MTTVYYLPKITVSRRLQFLSNETKSDGPNATYEFTSIIVDGRSNKYSQKSLVESMQPRIAYIPIQLSQVQQKAHKFTQ